MIITVSNNVTVDSELSRFVEGIVPLKERNEEFAQCLTTLGTLGKATITSVYPTYMEGTVGDRLFVVSQNGYSAKSSLPGVETCLKYRWELETTK